MTSISKIKFSRMDDPHSKFSFLILKNCLKHFHIQDTPTLLSMNLKARKRVSCVAKLNQPSINYLPEMIMLAKKAFVINCLTTNRIQLYFNSSTIKIYSLRHSSQSKQSASKKAFIINCLTTNRIQLYFNSSTVKMQSASEESMPRLIL